jgi:hypothetical protein
MVFTRKTIKARDGAEIVRYQLIHPFSRQRRHVKIQAFSGFGQVLLIKFQLPVGCYGNFI